MKTAIQRALNLSRLYKQILQAVLDLVLGVLCLFIAFYLQPDVAFGMDGLRYAILFLIVPGIAVASFAVAGLYRAILRYITGSALQAIVPGVALSTGVLGVGMFIATGQPGVPVLVHFGLSFLFVLGGSRLLLRWIFRLPAKNRRQPAIIYGAGQAGQQLIAALNLASGYVPVAFVDDDTHLHGATINGVRVHPAASLRTLIDKWAVREVLMAMPSIPRTRRRKIVAQLEDLGVEVKTIPSMTDVVCGKARVTDLQPITPEDLLGRDPVAPSPALMRRTIKDKVVLVTGAGGSIGSELCRQIVEQGPRALILLDISEFALYAINTALSDHFLSRSEAPEIVPILGSVANRARMDDILITYGVQTIFHAAAYKHVGVLEGNIVAGIQNNVFGTRVLSDAAVAAGVERFILISTDKTVRPASIMGASKRLAELICQAQARVQRRTVFSIVRFGNVLGSSGSVIPRFRDQIERGGPVTVTHAEVTRYFMSVKEAAQLVIQAGAMAQGGEVFLLDMGKPVKILELAKSMIRMHGLTPYVVNAANRPYTEVGDIAIKITGLRQGEKLTEELLIGRNSRETDHPRIMAASEVSLDAVTLGLLLDELFQSCLTFDLGAIRALLLAAPLDYTSDTAQDIMVLRAKITDEKAHQKSAFRLVTPPASLAAKGKVAAASAK